VACAASGVGNSGGGRRGTRSACAGPGRGGRCERVRASVGEGRAGAGRAATVWSVRP